MAKTALRLDNVDLFSALRVGEGEGFDPADGDFINPTFGESGGEGSPLISRYVDNVEPQIPIHVSVRDAPDFTTVTNDIPNPRFRGPSSSLWTAQANSGSPTITAQSANAIVGGGYDAAAGSVLLDNGAVVIPGGFVDATDSTNHPVVPGQRVSCSVWATMIAVDTSALFTNRINWYTTGSVFISSTDAALAVGGSVSGRVVRLDNNNAKAPDTAAFYHIEVILANATNSFRNKFALGAVVAQRDCAAVKLYHDGDSPGWQWSGTSHASASFGPAVPMGNYLHNPRPAASTINPKPVFGSPATVAGWTRISSNQSNDYITDDETSPTGQAMVIPYDTNAANEIRNAPSFSSVQGHHVLPGDWVCLSMWMKANTAAQSALSEGTVDSLSNIRLAAQDSITLAYTLTNGSVRRTVTDWQFLTASVQVGIGAFQFYVSIFGRGNSIADAEVRFAGGTLGRGSTQAEAEAVAKTLGSSSFFDGDSLDAEWTTLPDAAASRTLHFSCRYTNKPGLQSAIAKVENTCLNAQSLEWRDDGAGRTTFRDVLAGRFEADYKYRRAQRKWFSGMVHLWTRPYAHSGTFAGQPQGGVGWIGQDVVADDPILGVNIPRIGGDYNAELSVLIKTSGTYPVTQGRIVGVCAAPSGRIVVVPAASINILGVATNWSAARSATITGGGAGFGGAIATSTINAGSLDLDKEVGRFICAPSQVAGRSRVLAFVRAAGQGQLFYAQDGRGNQLGPGAMASSLAGYNIADLGILDVQMSPQFPTAVLSIRSRPTDEAYVGVINSPCLTGLLLVPEDNSQIVIDSARRMIGWDQFKTAYNNVDKVGNTYSPMQGTAVFNFISDTGVRAGLRIASAFLVGGVFAYADAYLSNAPTVADMEVAAEVITSMYASAAVFVGKRARGILGSSFGDQYAQFHITNGSQAVLTLWTGPNLLASMAVPGTVAFGADFVGEVRFRSKAGVISADVRSDASFGSQALASIGVIVGTSYTAGQPFLAVKTASQSSPMTVKAWRSSEVPSTALSPGDYYTFSPTGIIRTSGLTGWDTGKVSAIGQSKLMASPGFNTQVYGFEQSLDEFTGANNRLDFVSVFVRERFTYAR